MQVHTSFMTSRNCWSCEGLGEELGCDSAASRQGASPFSRAGSLPALNGRLELFLLFFCLDRKAFSASELRFVMQNCRTVHGYAVSPCSPKKHGRYPMRQGSPCHDWLSHPLQHCGGHWCPSGWPRFFPVFPAPTAVLTALHFQWQAGMWQCTGAGAHTLGSFTLSPEQMQDICFLSSWAMSSWLSELLAEAFSYSLSYFY